MAIRIGTRTSKLALKQADEFIELLRKAGVRDELEIVGIETAGDRDRDTSISEVEGTDFFTGEIEHRLLAGEVDLALHSAKDLPDRIPEGLAVAAITRGTDNRDVFMSRDRKPLRELPSGARVGTSSIRRKEQLAGVRPDIRIVDVRGNVDERVRKVDEGELDGIVIAAAGMIRLGMKERIAEYLDFETPFLQGRLAVEIRKGDKKVQSLVESIDDRKHWGRVYIIGAGPGDPGLITVKGLRRLNEADVVLYDDLVNKRVLADARGEKIHVGKRKGGPEQSQDSINRLMVQYAGQGKKAVRLKGGDPFIFGRGGEEIEFLRRNSVSYEVIPGITAGVAAAAYADIPLTHRGVSSSVALCTGHPVESIQVPDADTLVYYMAASSAGTVLREVLARGIPPETPVALVMRASLPDQEVVTGTAGELAGSGQRYSSPLIMIIGKAAGLHAGESWFIHKKKVLVTGTNPEKYEFLGEVTHLPLIDLVPLEDYTEVDNVITRLQEYTSVVFTSKHAVRYFFDRIFILEKDSRILSGIKIFSIGSETTKALKKYGTVPDGQPVFESSAGLVEYFHSLNLKHERILLPCSNLAHNDLPEALRGLGNKVFPVTAYLNRPPGTTDGIDPAAFDTIVFTSPSGVSNFRKIYGALPDNVDVYTIGPVTRREVDDVLAR